MTLRQVADCIDAMPLNQALDALRLTGPAEELFAAARLVFGRPFGN